MTRLELAAKIAVEYPVPTEVVIGLLMMYRDDERKVRTALDCHVRALPCPLPTDA